MSQHHPQLKRILLFAKRITEEEEDNHFGPMFTWLQNQSKASRLWHDDHLKCKHTCDSSKIVETEYFKMRMRTSKNVLFMFCVLSKSEIQQYNLLRNILKAQREREIIYTIRIFESDTYSDRSAIQTRNTFKIPSQQKCI